MNSKKVREKGGGGSSTVSKFDKQPQLKISLNEKEMEMEMGMIRLDWKDVTNKLDLFMFHVQYCLHTHIQRERKREERVCVCVSVCVLHVYTQSRVFASTAWYFDNDKYLCAQTTFIHY